MTGPRMPPSCCRLLSALLIAVPLAGCSLWGPPHEAPSSRPTPVPTGPAPRPTPPPSVVAPPAPPPPAAAHPTEPPKVPVAPPAAEPTAREYHLGPAAASLVQRAHTQMAARDLAGASTTLDRALHIEPQNPLLWIEVARLRLAEGDGRQSESCARKALALGGLDPSVRANAGHALADALRAQHREQEAHDIEAQPWMN